MPNGLEGRDINMHGQYPIHRPRLLFYREPWSYCSKPIRETIGFVSPLTIQSSDELFIDSLISAPTSLANGFVLLPRLFRRWELVSAAAVPRRAASQAAGRHALPFGSGADPSRPSAQPQEVKLRK